MTQNEELKRYTLDTSVHYDHGPFVIPAGTVVMVASKVDDALRRAKAEALQEHAKAMRHASALYGNDMWRERKAVLEDALDAERERVRQGLLDRMELQRELATLQAQLRLVGEERDALLVNLDACRGNELAAENETLRTDLTTLRQLVEVLANAHCPNHDDGHCVCYVHQARATLRSIHPTEDAR